MSRNNFFSGKSNSNRGASNPQRGASNPHRGTNNHRRRLIIETRESAMAAFIKSLSVNHAAKFVPSKSGGLMAAIRVDNRIVFPDSRGPQPKNDDQTYRFQIVGENPKGSVYFARIITGDEAPFKIEVQKSGKMVCVGCKPLLRYRSKPAASPLDELRCATPTSSFEPQDDDDRVFEVEEFDDWRQYNDDYRLAGQAHHDCGRDCAHDGDDDEDDERDQESDFNQEVDPIYDALPTKIVNCHACGFDDCRCDGTGSDWVPYRTTLNVLA